MEINEAQARRILFFYMVTRTEGQACAGDEPLIEQIEKSFGLNRAVAHIHGLDLDHFLDPQKSENSKTA